MINRISSALFALIILLSNGRALLAQAKTISSPPSLRSELHIGPNDTYGNLSITRQKLYLAGKITGNLHATNCDIIIQRGGNIGGTLYLRGGSLQNETGNEVRVSPSSASGAAAPAAETVSAVRSGSAPAPAVYDGSAGPIVSANFILTGASVSSASDARSPSRKDWFGAQMALLILGLLAGAVVRLAAPRAANRAAATVGVQPGRCFLVGAASAVGLGMVSLMNVSLLMTPIRALWFPLGFVVASGVVVLLGFGWLCGMRALGEVVAAKTGRDTAGDFFIRLALGLSVFFLCNTLLGSVGSWLGAIGLTAQFVVSVMGLGAAVITGLGKSDNWLGAKTRGRC